MTVTGWPYWDMFFYIFSGECDNLSRVQTARLQSESDGKREVMSSNLGESYRAFVFKDTSWSDDDDDEFPFEISIESLVNGDV